MNYRHAYHAGNFADVFKHIILTRLIEYLKKKDKPFRVHDTHAGPGLYSLTSDEAGKTGEWADGIGRLRKASIPRSVAQLLEPYLQSLGDDAGAYPGSPLIARKLLRKQDRLSLCELHPEDHLRLASLFEGDYQVRVNKLDGWLVAGAHLPPKEARGMMMIDPPFEQEGEFDRLIDALLKANRRWSGGTLALWYPVKRRAHTDEWLGTLRDLNIANMMSAELTIRPPNAVQTLNGCGMVIVNPPYTLEEELTQILPFLAKTLGEDRKGGWRLQWLNQNH